MCCLLNSQVVVNERDLNFFYKNTAVIPYSLPIFLYLLDLYHNFRYFRYEFDQTFLKIWLRLDKNERISRRLRIEEPLSWIESRFLLVVPSSMYPQT